MIDILNCILCRGNNIITVIEPGAEPEYPSNGSEGTDTTATIVVDVVDDDNLNRVILVRWLQKIDGVHVRHKLRDGQLYIDLMKSKYTPPDVLFTDIIMPVMTGDRLCRLIKQSKYKNAFPIVAVTGSISVDYIGLYGDVGFDRVIYKPYKFQHIQEIISALK